MIDSKEIIDRVLKIVIIFIKKKKIAERFFARNPTHNVDTESGAHEPPCFGLP